MPIPIPYVELSQRLKDARTWAPGITEGNRCAVVVGTALRLKPLPHQLSFRNQRSANPSVRAMPFLDRLFLKAADVSEVIQRTYGPPLIRSTGAELIAYAQKIPGSTVFDGRRGVMYLENCWKTMRDRISFSDASGDHIDLWDGRCLEIYRDKGRNAVIAGLLANAGHILFWTAP